MVSRHVLEIKVPPFLELQVYAFSFFLRPQSNTKAILMQTRLKASSSLSLHPMGKVHAKESFVEFFSRLKTKEILALSLLLGRTEEEQFNLSSRSVCRIVLEEIEGIRFVRFLN